MAKPLVDAVFATEFGGVEDSPEFRDETQAALDYTYVPGYSDLRRKRDLEVAEMAKGTRRAEDVSVLPVNLRWTRCANKQGEADAMKVMSAKNVGWRAVTGKDVEAKHAWLKGLPPGARVQADGSIVNAAGDCVLMVMDGKTAAKRAYRKALATREQIEGVGAGSDGFLAEGSKLAGAKPTVERS